MHRARLEHFATELAVEGFVAFQDNDVGAALRQQETKQQTRRSPADNTDMRVKACHNALSFSRGETRPQALSHGLHRARLYGRTYARPMVNIALVLGIHSDRCGQTFGISCQVSPADSETGENTHQSWYRACFRVRRTAQ